MTLVNDDAILVILFHQMFYSEDHADNSKGQRFINYENIIIFRSL